MPQLVAADVFDNHVVRPLASWQAVLQAAHDLLGRSNVLNQFTGTRSAGSSFWKRRSARSQHEPSDSFRQTSVN
jgi:hypothetical protein